MTARRQQGASAAMVLVIFALVMVVGLAGLSLRRLAEASGDRTDTQKRLDAAALALEQYAATHKRLPCPADPSLATGLEATATAATCSFPATGTLPWATLGMKLEDGYDAWGRKLTYRVYTGTAGSLTQPGGVDMVQCDLVEPSAGATTGAGSAGGMCVTNADPLLRSTSSSAYLLGKGFVVKDNGIDVPGVAFVVISHGQTGFGGFTASGVQMNVAKVHNAGDENQNLQAAGPFVTRKFSDVEEKVDAKDHFDDLLAYRRLPDLVQRIGLAARDWPEPPVGTPTMGTGALTAVNVGSALGTGTAAPGSLGTNTFQIGGVTLSGYGAGATPSPLSFDQPSGGAGIGVAGNVSNLMTNYGGEYVEAAFPALARKFAVTMFDFGIYFTFRERVQLSFYNGTSLVHSVVKSGCNADGGFATFAFDAPADFNKVRIEPVGAVSPDFDGFEAVSAFLLSEVTACTTAASSCTTSLATAGNTCP